jgi:hypothetical protein
MSTAHIPVGQVLWASTGKFAIGCALAAVQHMHALPRFGTLVRGDAGSGETIYGLIYDITVEDDPLVRQLVASGVDRAEYIEDVRQHRQVPVTVEVLVVGYGEDEAIYYRLPPLPPGSLNAIYPCAAAETVRFTARHGWLRAVLNATDLPAEELAAAALRAAIAARPADQRDAYLLEAGRELARLLAADPARVDSLLEKVS